MKRLTALLLCVLLLLGMAACGGKDVSGLGTLTMDDGGQTKDDDGGVGTLGEPAGDPDSDPDSEPANVPDDEPEPADEPDDAPDSEPEPAATAKPLPTEPPAQDVPLEAYSCADFTMNIPQGWDVVYDVVDAGEGMMRIYLFVQDPEDSNNILFFVQALEPFFTSADSKAAWVGVIGDTYDWAPVIDGDPSAEAVLGQWPVIYTFMDVLGEPLLPYFKNYGVQEILSTSIVDNATAADTCSNVLARVSIPGASGDYAFFLDNELIRMDAPSGLPSYAQYYISYSNFGIVVSAEKYETMFDALYSCLVSLNLGGFNDRYNMTAESNSRPERPSGVPLG